MKAKWKKIQAVALIGCVLTFGVAPGSEVALAEASPEIQLDEVKIPLANMPQAPGTTVYANDKAAIDASNITQGYISVKYTGGGSSRIRAQVIKSGGATYTYEVNNKGNYETYPLSCGNGKYTIKVFENTSGNKYAQLLSQEINVTLANDFVPFLYPNQYVNFGSNSQVVQKASQLASTKGDDLETIANVYHFVIDNITYDTQLAQTVQSGYLPDVDAVLKKGSGICFDYAALMSAMLRSQNIPSKLVIGYTGNLYHAWINAYVDEVGWIDNIICFDGKNWQLMDPTFASGGKGDASIQQYIGDGKNYQSKYTY